MIATSSQFKKPQEVNIQLEGLPAIYSPEAEREVLGSMLTDPEAVVDEAIEQLSPEDFFNPAHRQIFEVMVEMQNEHRPIEINTVCQYLEDRKLAEGVGGLAFLAELTAGVLSVLTASARIQTVKEKGILRRLREACAHIVLDTRDRQHEVDQVLDEAESAIFKLNEKSISKTSRPAEKIVIEAIKIIEQTAKMKGQYNGIPSGFFELDRLTTGFKAGEMIVVAARPGVGKTAFALSMVKNMLKEKYSADEEKIIKPGHAVAFFSLEMTGSNSCSVSWPPVLTSACRRCVRAI
jgi:replicative DNA helicase